MSSAGVDIGQAVRQFGESGDTETLVRALSGGADEVNPFVILQHAMQTVDDPDSRDLLDEAMWAMTSENEIQPKASERDVNEVKQACEVAFGPLIRDVVPDLQDLARALLEANRPAPPINAVAAACGLHAMQSSEPFRVSKDDLGKQTRFFNTGCEECGGSQGSSGYIVCRSCLGRARNALARRILRSRIEKEIAQLPSHQRMNMDVEATVAENMRRLDNLINVDNIPEGMVAEFIRENSRDFGCPACGQTPVRDCACAVRLTIPRRCSDGRIVKGERPASGEPVYVMLRLES